MQCEGWVAVLLALGGVAGLAPAAAGPTPNVVRITISCFEFVPDAAVLHNGDVVEWFWDDACPAAHSVTSSGTTGVASFDLNKPKPNFPGLCFDSNHEPEGFLLLPLTPLYRLHLTNEVLLVRDADTDDEKMCPTEASINLPSTALVVPYNCKLHGVEQPAGEGMRGALVIEP